MANIDEGAGEPIDCSRHPWEARVLTARLTFLVVSTLSVFALGVVLLVATEAKEATEFSMELSAFEGLNATASETVLSPAWLHSVSSYTSRIPVSFNLGAPTVARWWRAPTELPLLAWGREVGLSDDVRRRLASELHGGTAQVTVGMKLFYDAKGWSSPESYRGTSLQLFQLLLGSSTERRNK
ncbi:unnamed protein product [Urochloa decumbens]|uniref:Uncharacterized protein n=1 Tax=Urochloa decumbens TaxID=240449 RepID=A0ABC8YUL9_9POAL